MRCYNLQTARQNLAQVDTLILDGQHLEHLPPELWQMPLLETLDLRNNALRSLPLELNELPSLRYLFLGNNLLQELPAHLPTLLQLDLSGNNFAHFPTSLSLSKLQILNLSSNRLRAIPALVMPALKELNLNGNRIKQFSLQEAQYPALEKLLLHNNGLQQFELQGKFPRLHTIDCSKNKLDVLADQFSGVSFLRHLDLSKNHLSNLPPSLLNCVWLKNLDLSGNVLENLPPWIAQLPRLESLNLTQNQLVQWPDLPLTLRQLHLAKNRLQALPQAFLQESQVRQLDLSHNPLQRVQGLARCPHLKRLRLQGIQALDLAELILNLPRPAVIQGSLSHPQAKALLSLSRVLAKQNLPLESRQLLWAAFSGQRNWASVPSSLIFQGLSLGLAALQEQLLTHLAQNKPVPAQFPIGTGLAWFGRSARSKGAWQKRLDAAGWHCCALEQASAWVIGKAPFPKQVPDLPQVICLRESELERMLSPAVSAFAPVEQENLQQLLLHPTAQHVQLATQLLQHHGVPKGLLPALYLAWRWAEERGLKQDLRALLEHYWPWEKKELLRSREKWNREEMEHCLDKLRAALS